jgi:hypothetical protein
MGTVPEGAGPLPLPWHWSDEIFGTELSDELPEEHRLAGLALTCIAYRQDMDDFLYEVADAGIAYAIVHRTWRRETDPRWPAARVFRTWAEVWEVLEADAADFE